MEQLPRFTLPASPEDIDMVSGRFPPQRVRVEPADSINILIKSEDRTYGNDFEFQCDLITTSSHIRKIQLAKCMLPLLPQINFHNKNILITHADGAINVNFVEGYYSVQGMVNMMQSVLTAAWIVLDATNSVTVSYSIERRSISIVDDNGENFFIHTNCGFSLYGRNVVQFVTKVAGSALSASIYESTSLGMIYSRYVTLHSSRLTEDQNSYSIISSRGPSNIIAILDLSSEYTTSQFAVSSAFPGTDITIDTLNYAPRINILNRNKGLKVIDFYLEDEFSFKLNDLNTASHSFTYPVAFFFQCSL